MTARIKPLAYADDGYSHACKACMARAIVDQSVSEMHRTMRHVFRDMDSLIRASAHPIAVKIRKRAGLDIRRGKMFDALDKLLGAFFDVWEELETIADHERDAVKTFRKARVKGAKSKHAKDPAQAARRDARKHWPKAAQRGMTALEFHSELVRLGHSVPPDTVRKWVTKLRKTGTC